MPLHWRKARSWRGSLFPETLSQGSHIQPLHQLPVRDDQKGGAKPEHKGHARKEHGPDVPGKEDRLKRRVEMPRGDGQRKVLQRVGHTVDVMQKRLVGRGTETADVIAQRLARAYEESEGMDAYDYIVVNDDLDECAAAVQKYVEAAKNVPSRRVEFITEIREELKGFAKGAK